MRDATALRALVSLAMCLALAVMLSLCTGCNAQGQWDAVETLKVTRRVVRVVCTAAGALDALPDDAPLLIDRNGTLRAQPYSSGAP